jgi:hypothetical protein
MFRYIAVAVIGLFLGKLATHAIYNNWERTVCDGMTELVATAVEQAKDLHENTEQVIHFSMTVDPVIIFKNTFKIDAYVYSNRTVDFVYTLDGGSNQEKIQHSRIMDITKENLIRLIGPMTSTACDVIITSSDIFRVVEPTTASM